MNLSLWNHRKLKIYCSNLYISLSAFYAIMINVGAAAVSSNLLSTRAGFPPACNKIIGSEVVLENSNKFAYFGYGSNMLAARIHIQNPTAQRIGVGELKNYRLDFYNYSERWLGAPASIVPQENGTVFGALWEIDIRNLGDLDNQEGVNLGVYRPINLPVKQSDGTMKIARIYELVSQPTTNRDSYNDNNIPLDRQPSKTYLQCLVKGAIESGINLEYINWLKAIKHNGNVVKTLELNLDLANIVL